MPIFYLKIQAPAQKKDTPSSVSILDASSQSEALQRKASMANNAAQREKAPRPNNTGMPDNLKSGIESLSGFSMDDVRVHYNSSKPATVQALAYTQGTDIHVAPGQEKHLPHEAWHVAQQMTGKVSPTTNINGMPVNDNAALEHEADVMGEKAVQCKGKIQGYRNQPINDKRLIQSVSQSAYQKYTDVIQRIDDIDDLVGFVISFFSEENRDLGGIYKAAVVANKSNYVKTNLLLCWQKYGKKSMHNAMYDDVINPAKHRETSKLKNVFNSLPRILNPADSKSAMNQDIESSQDKEKECNDAFNIGCALLCEFIVDLLAGKTTDRLHECKRCLMKFILSDFMICYKVGRDVSGVNSRQTIWEFVEAQMAAYANQPARQISVLILGVARKIAYILGDPWAENRIARLLNKKIEDELKTEINNKNFFNEVRAFARSNPILMYINHELNKHDACHLINIRAKKMKRRDFGYKQMFDMLKEDALNVLNSMGSDKKKSLLRNGSGDFNPSTLGMFRLYRTNKIEGMKSKIDDLSVYDPAYDSFVDPSIEWMKKANENADEEMKKKLDKKQLEDCKLILGKLLNAPVTIRLHSSDLQYQERPDEKKDPWFYHAKPWFKSVKLGDTNVPYHPSSGRDGNEHYSLWRTFKDHFYRGMPWKRGRDGITTGTYSQSIDKGGAIQQSFGALNFNYQNNCYGLFGGYDYGNISLVLKNSVKQNCIYTIGDKGIPFYHIYAVAHALARCQNRNDAYGIGGDFNSIVYHVKESILNGDSNNDEQIEAQIFQDVKFGPGGDIDKIVCFGVTDDEYIQLLDMVGVNIDKLEKDDKGKVNEEKYKNFVERY